MSTNNHGSFNKPIFKYLVAPLFVVLLGLIIEYSLFKADDSKVQNIRMEHYPNKEYNAPQKPKDRIRDTLIDTRELKILDFNTFNKKFSLLNRLFGRVISFLPLLFSIVILMYDPSIYVIVSALTGCLGAFILWFVAFLVAFLICIPFVWSMGLVFEFEPFIYTIKIWESWGNKFAAIL